MIEVATINTPAVVVAAPSDIRIKIGTNPKGETDVADETEVAAIDPNAIRIVSGNGTNPIVEVVVVDGTVVAVIVPSAIRIKKTGRKTPPVNS